MNVADFASDQRQASRGFTRGEQEVNEEMILELKAPLAMPSRPGLQINLSGLLLIMNFWIRLCLVYRWLSANRFSR